MKISTKILVLIVVSTLSAGLLLGWVFFGGKEESPIHSHTEEINGETIWTCSMHPQIRQNEPGSCPICGMELIPLEEDTEQTDPMAVSMSPTAVSLANIKTAKTGTTLPVKTISLSGKIKEDERLVFSQTTHIPGRVESLRINFTGEYVSAGTVLAYLYSPELVTAQKELFQTYAIRESQPELYRSAREKLKNWKLTDRQIDEILDTEKIRENFPILADQSGYVIEKMVNPGDYLSRGETIYKIANLSRVWVLFDVYESDLPWINEGDSITFTVASLPGQTYQSVIEYLDPVIHPQTRVASARVVIKNPDNRLKPETFVSGEVTSRLSKDKNTLVIPKSSVMWTGKRSVVYVKTTSDQGLYFRMREVTLGPSVGDSFIIESGLEPGEEIAVSGTFSIDAAAQLAGKPSMMSPHPTAMQGHETEESMKLPEVNEMENTFVTGNAFKNQLRNVFEAYLPVKDALVQSEQAVVKSTAKELENALNAVDMKYIQGEAHKVWMEDLSSLKASVSLISSSSNLKKMREALSPLSDQLYHSLKKFRVEVEGYRQYCPMAKNNKGAYWLSDSDEILNPYFGDTMLTCGNVDDELFTN